MKLNVKIRANEISNKQLKETIKFYDDLEYEIKDAHPDFVVKIKVDDRTRFPSAQ